MISSQAALWLVSAAALVTGGTAVAATQLVATSQPAAHAHKTPSAEPPAKSLTLSGNLTVSGLAPGVSVTRTLTIGNDNNQDVELQSVRTTLAGPSPTPTVGSCTSPADVEVLVAGFNASTGVGAPVTIKKASTLGVPVTVRMSNSPTRNQDACKAKTFTFTFTATATSK